MKKLIVLFFVILSAFLSCSTQEVLESEQTGAGKTDNKCYTEQSSDGIPTLIWMLEGGKSKYYDWDKDNYYHFNSEWKWGECGGVLKRHTGWDVKIIDGSIIDKEVYAVADGKVVRVNLASNTQDWGYFVTIEHKGLSGNLFTTNYTHVKPIANLEGTNVIAGQKIGSIYETSTPHLHFSLRNRAYSDNGNYNLNIANAGALPAYNNSCDCGGYPVFPEYFINPANLKFEERNTILVNQEYPIENSTDIYIPILFTWSKISGDPLYRIQVSKSANWTKENGFVNDLVVNQNTESNNYYQWVQGATGTIEPPSNSSIYYWSVKVFINNTSSYYSNPKKFTTIKVSTSDCSLTGNLNYGNISVGSSSNKTFTIQNTSKTILSVSNIICPTGYSVDWNYGTIAAGATKIVNVTFSPEKSITYNGTITVNSNASNGAQTIAVTGMGIDIPTANCTLSGNLNFGNIEVGSSATQSFMIQNTGSAALSVSSISYPNTCSLSWTNGTIAAGSSKNVTVTFSPSSAITYNGNITVNSNASNGTQSISIIGVGTVTATANCAISGNMNFGNVNTGSTSSKTLTIQNTGNSTLSVSSINCPSGYGLSWTNGSISAGSSKSVTVSFTPTSSSSYNGTITVYSNATNGTQSLSISGTGIEPITFTPSLGTYTNCPTGGTISGSGNCDGNNYHDATLVFKVSSYSSTTNTITFTVKKCTGTFASSGTVYLKEGDYCGTVVDNTTYAAGASTMTLSVQPSSKSGTYYYTCILISNNVTKDKYYTETIIVKY